MKIIAVIVCILAGEALAAPRRRLKTKQREHRIVGGTNSLPHEFPFFVEGIEGCGGALIHEGKSGYFCLIFREGLSLLLLTLFIVPGNAFSFRFSFDGQSLSACFST